MDLLGLYPVFTRCQGEGQSEEMFGYALRHPRCPARNGELNAVGLTPLTLACRLARSEIFREMLELTCVEFWRYSNITCSAYPLNALDTIGPDGRTSETGRGKGENRSRWGSWDNRARRQDQ